MNEKDPSDSWGDVKPPKPRRPHPNSKVQRDLLIKLYAAAPVKAAFDAARLPGESLSACVRRLAWTALQAQVKP